MTSPLLLWTILLAGAVIPQTPPPEDPHFARGIEYQKEGRLDEAIAEYELSLKSRPRFPVLANLGSVYVRLGRYEEAIARYEQALKLAPGQPAVTLNLGLAYYKTGDFQKSVVLFEQVLRSEPENLQARTLLADCHFELGDFKKVIEQLEDSAEKHPDDLAIAYLLGTAYIRDKQSEKGQRLVDRILSKGDSAEVHLMLGVASAEAREFKTAIAEFERAIQLNPKIPQAHSSLGRVLLQSGDRDRALPEFEAELKISPNDFHANLYAGFLRRRNDQDDEALPHLLKAQRLRPGDASVAFQISLIHMNKGELNEAQRMLEEIVKQQPDLIDAHVTLARVYYKKKMKAEGDREQAIVEKLRAQLQKLQPGSQKSAEIKEEEEAGGKPQPAKPSKP